MAAKETTLPGSVVVETVGQSLTINRIPVASKPPTIQFAVNSTYVDNTYLVDADGTKIQLLQQGSDTRYLGLTPQESGELYLIPCTSARYPGLSTLGDILAAAWDAAIVADLAAKAAV